MCVYIYISNQFFQLWNRSKKSVKLKKTKTKENTWQTRAALTSVDDAHRISHIVRNVGSEPRPQFFMDLLSLDTITDTHIQHHSTCIKGIKCSWTRETEAILYLNLISDYRGNLRNWQINILEWVSINLCKCDIELHWFIQCSGRGTVDGVSGTCSGEAVFPVPIAHTGSYASTTLLQSFTLSKAPRQGFRKKTESF